MGFTCPVPALVIEPAIGPLQEPISGGTSFHSRSLTIGMAFPGFNPSTTLNAFAALTLNERSQFYVTSTILDMVASTVLSTSTGISQSAALAMISALSLGATAGLSLANVAALVASTTFNASPALTALGNLGMTTYLALQTVAAIQEATQMMMNSAVSMGATPVMAIAVGNAFLQQLTIDLDPEFAAAFGGVMPSFAIGTTVEVGPARATRQV